VLPHWWWFDVDGIAGRDDFAVEAGQLVISERALDVLRSLRLEYAEVKPWPERIRRLSVRSPGPV